MIAEVRRNDEVSVEKQRVAKESGPIEMERMAHCHLGMSYCPVLRGRPRRAMRRWKRWRRYSILHPFSPIGSVSPSPGHRVLRKGESVQSQRAERDEG